MVLWLCRGPSVIYSYQQHEPCANAVLYVLLQYLTPNINCIVQSHMHFMKSSVKVVTSEFFCVELKTREREVQRESASKPLLIPSECAFVGLLVFSLRVPKRCYSVLCMWCVIVYAYSVPCTSHDGIAQTQKSPTSGSNTGRDHLVRHSVHNTQMYMACNQPLELYR